MAKKQKNKQNNFLAELKQRLPILKFIGGFIVFTIVFYLLTDADWFDTFRAPLVAAYTNISSVLLNIFGQSTNANGAMLTSPRFSVNVQEGCDAIVPTILYITAVLVFPTSWRHKMWGLGIGVPALFGLNLIRIISLFITGLYAPQFFDFMHVEFWQALFIILTVLLFIQWLKRSNINPAGA